MKAEQVVQFTTTDGRAFTDETAARIHEVQLGIDQLRDEDASRLTALEMIRLLADHPQHFIDTLGLLLDDDDDETADKPNGRGRKAK
jgi:hypothetical protein